MKVIKIGAMWCPACLIVNKVLKKIDIDVISYDYDYDVDMVKKYNVLNILPVLIFVDDAGNEVDRLVGEVSKNDILLLIGGDIDDEVS
ncbi:MAG: thioredoxin family protein [Bacilli bacterium]